MYRTQRWVFIFAFLQDRISTFIHYQWTNGIVTVETFWQFLRKLKKVPCDLREMKTCPYRLMCEYP